MGTTQSRHSDSGGNNNLDRSENKSIISRFKRKIRSTSITNPPDVQQLQTEAEQAAQQLAPNDPLVQGALASLIKSGRKYEASPQKSEAVSLVRSEQEVLGESSPATSPQIIEIIETRETRDSS